MNNKHTPGPWMNESGDIGAGEGDNFKRVAMTAKGTFGETHNMTDKEHEANARLIAAAPDLLAECLRAQDELASACRDGAGHFTPEMLNAWFKGVSETIKKAKGEE